MRETPARVSLRTATAPARLLLILLLLLGAAPAFGASDRGGEKSGSVKVRVAGAVAERSVAAAGGTLVARYESFSVWRIASARARALALRTEAVEVLENANEILLNTGALDTASAGTMALRRSVGSFSGKRLHLVQFAGPVQPEWYASLVATGVQVVQPIPSYAYLVWGDASAIGRAQSMAQSSSVVQWDGAYEPEYKIQPSARALGKSAARDMKAGDAGLDLYQVQLVKDDETNAATFQAVSSIQTSAVRQQYEILSYVNFVVGLNAAFVKDLAARPDVVSIAKWTEPKKLDERADLIMAGQLTGNAPTATDYLAYLAGKGFTQGQFTASNFIVDLTDSGVDNATPASPNHFALRLSGDPTLASRFAYSRLEGTPNGGSTLQGCDGHGNLNAHLICGFVPGGAPFNAFPHADASGFRYGMGVAPFVKVGSSVIFDPDTFTFPNFANLQSKAYNDGARISSNGWGSSSNSYTVDAQAYDSLVRDAQPAGSTFPVAGNQEMVIVFAAGNGGSGANTVGAPGTGKNVITVGGSESVQAFGGADSCGVGDTSADSANDVIGFSSRGPTSDGRRKPDLVAPATHLSGGVFQAANVSPVSGTGAAGACFNGTGVCGGTGGSNFFPGGQQWYTGSSGTSHATPEVAGTAALIRQHFINQGQPAPSPAMTKAILMNGARYLNGTGANDTLWSNNQGMGEVNLQSTLDVFTAAHVLHDELGPDRFTASGQTRILTGNVANPGQPVRVTLAWTDAPGPTSGNAFVNNLDLEVTIGGTTYKGNVFSGAFSAAGGTADARNNVESVFIPAGATGSLVIKVKGVNIAGNGVPGNADPLDQDFALVAYNVAEAPLPVMAGGATALTAESCAPANSAIDPGETVTVDLGLLNIGTANTANLVATLQATGGVTSPSGAQNYAAVVAGGPAVTRPFTFTASTTCGQTISATLQLQDGATNLGTATFTFLTGALGAPVIATYSTGNVAVPIPDVSSVDVPINVSDTGVVSDINVRVRLNHTFDGDLVISLVSPAGTTVVLAQNRGGSGANYGTGANDCSGTHTIFDDGAATAIGAGTAPFAGSFRPDTPLSVLNGEFVAGTWKLRVADTSALDTGTVGCVSLEITRQRFVCCGVTGTPQIASGGAATITAESFAPANNTPDPGETVTATFPLLNIGDGNTTNLVATLQNSGGVTPITTTQNYGVVLAAGAAVSRPFTFIASGACGGTITATLHLQDGALDLGNVTFTFTLGTSSTSSLTFSNSAALTIPATGTGASTGAPATPYPSNITVSGVPVAGLSRITVTLNGYSHGFPDDVDILLVSPTGAKMIVMSDSGNATDAVNATLTLDDAAVSALPDLDGIVSGTFRPSNYGTVQDPFPAPAPAGPYLTPAPGGAATLTSAFTAGNPNGTWSLYVVDDAATDIGSITGGWSITFFTTTAVCATGPPAPPTLALSFAAPSVRLGGSIALSFTITNPNPSTALTGVGFAGTLPAGLVIATPNGASATTCIPPGTITATAGTSLISMAGVTLPPGTSCGFSINITANLAGLRSTGVTPGSANGGSGSPATAALAVVAPPDIAKAFGAATVPTGGTTGLTITLTNPAANTVALTGVGFTDPLPAGLVVATPNALVNTCGGTATAVAGSSSVSLTGGTVPIASSCSVTVNVTAATNGVLTNVTGTVTSTEGGAGATATANLSVGQAALVDVPALGTWGLLLLAAALAVASGVLLARRG